MSESDEWVERVRQATVVFLDAARRDYLKTTGANPLKQYEMVANRARSAARMSTSVEEWTSAALRGLKVASPSSWVSSAMVALREGVGARSAEWLDLVEREIGYLMAEVQLRVDNRKVGDIGRTMGEYGEVF